MICPCTAKQQVYLNFRPQHSHLAFPPPVTSGCCKGFLPILQHDSTGAWWMVTSDLAAEKESFAYKFWLGSYKGLVLLAPSGEQSGRDEWSQDKILQGQALKRPLNDPPPLNEVKHPSECRNLSIRSILHRSQASEFFIVISKTLSEVLILTNSSKQKKRWLGFHFESGKL